MCAHELSHNIEVYYDTYVQQCVFFLVSLNQPYDVWFFLGSVSLNNWIALFFQGIEGTPVLLTRLVKKRTNNWHMPITHNNHPGDITQHENN
jgi:hypothetical protein